MQVTRELQSLRGALININIANIILQEIYNAPEVLWNSPVFYLKINGF